MTKKFKSIIKYSLSAVFLSMFLALAPVTADFSAINQVKAEGDWWQRVNDGGLNQVGQAYDGSTPRDIRMTIVDIIKIVLGFLGIITVVIILYAGFKWMTAGGNEENVATAKKMLINAVIGLVIILSAYALATFIISYIVGATTDTPVIWQ
ncbi:MAG: pilin [Patescibacteria group bacterium]